MEKSSNFLINIYPVHSNRPALIETQRPDAKRRRSVDMVHKIGIRSHLVEFSTRRRSVEDMQGMRRVPSTISTSAESILGAPMHDRPASASCET